MMTKVTSEEETFEISGLMHSSIARMSQLIDNVLDFARERLGGGLAERRPSPSEKFWSRSSRKSARRILMRPLKPIWMSPSLSDPTPSGCRRCFQICSEMRSRTDRPPDRSKFTPRLKIMSSNCRLSNAGAPIPHAALKQLFQPFYRGAVRPSQQGLGLGLFIASEIARAHGGTLTADSSAEETPPMRSNS